MKIILKMKYRHKIAIVIFFILLPFLVLSMFFVQKFWDERVDSLLSENRVELQSSVDSINELCRSGLQKLTYINNNSMIASFFSKGDFSDLVQNMTMYDSIKLIVDALVLSNTDISYMIYPVDKNAYNGRYIERLERLAGLLGEDEVAKLLGSDTLNYGVWMYQPEWNPGDGMGYIVCYKKMQPFDNMLAITELRIRVKKIIGCLSVEFPEGTIIRYQPDGLHQFFFQLNEEGDSAVWQAMPDETEVAVGNYHAIKINLNYATGSVTGYLPRTYTRTMLGSYLFFTILAVVASLMLLLFIVELASFFLTKRITKLVDRVSTNMENSISPYTAGKYWIEDDLGRIEAKFNEMLEKIHINYLYTLEYENEKKMMELDILQSKINPHFLYNTLSTMRWNCKNENMAQIIDSMVQYYRLTLSKGHTIVKISYELKLVEEYLKIQKYTYSSNFEYVIEVDEDVKDAWIVKHLLQPIVENSVLHGLNGLENGGGIIKLEGWQKGGIITLTITDNGVGMPQETVKKLMSGEYKSKMGGYGIQNIQKRISLYYGSIYTLDITSEPGKGTAVKITFPADHPDNLFGLNKE